MGQPYVPRVVPLSLPKISCLEELGVQRAPGYLNVQTRSALSGRHSLELQRSFAFQVKEEINPPNWVEMCHEDETRQTASQLTVSLQETEVKCQG